MRLFVNFLLTFPHIFKIVPQIPGQKRFSALYMGGIFLNNYTFYAILPLTLIYDMQYENLSTNSIVLYSLFLNKKKLSMTNKAFRDCDGVFINYTTSQICKHLRCGKDSAKKALCELEKAGLIRKKYQKNGLPLKIYVNDVFRLGTSNTDKPSEKPKPKSNFKPYSPAPAEEKKVSFDVARAEKLANDGTLDFGEMKIKKRRTRSNAPTI